jgi:hypothetical protein
MHFSTIQVFIETQNSIWAVPTWNHLSSLEAPLSKYAIRSKTAAKKWKLQASPTALFHCSLEDCSIDQLLRFDHFLHRENTVHGCWLLLYYYWYLRKCNFLKLALDIMSILVWYKILIDTLYIIWKQTYGQFMHWSFPKGWCKFLEHLKRNYDIP